MIKDAALLGAVVAAFATLVTVHLAIVYGLATRRPRWRAAVTLVVGPLAPYWAFREGMRVRAVVWLSALVAYAISLALASR